MSLSEENINNEFGDIDLELLDLILKGHFKERRKILDVGCGEGRNLIYFMQRDFDISAIDADKSSVELVKYIAKNFNKNPEQIVQGRIEEANYLPSSMDAIICTRVLHFSESESHFLKSWNSMRSILKPGGLLYFSTDSMIRFEDKVSNLSEDKWQFSDGSVRFLLSDRLLKKMNIGEQYDFLVPMKTIHYGDKHSQTILSLKKRT